MKFKLTCEYCKAQASLGLIMFVYLSNNAATSSTFALSMQYLLLCSASVILYHEVKHQQRLEYIPPTCTLN